MWFHGIESGESVSMFSFNINGLKVHELYFAFCPGYQLQFEEKRSCQAKYCIPLSLKKLEVKLSDSSPAVLKLDNPHDATLEDQMKRLYSYQMNETFFREHPLPLSDFFLVKSTSETYGNIFYVRLDSKQLPSQFTVKMYFTSEKQPIADLQCVMLLVKEKKLYVLPATTVNGVTTRRSVIIQ